MKRLVIIGGGAAGLMAANRIIEQSVRGLHITLVEKNSRPARKVMITGKGRCNVTNNCDVNTLIANTVKNGKFLYSAFNNFTSADTMNFFESRGVALKTERGNRVFPVSDKAVSIVDALSKAPLKYCQVLEDSAEEIITENGAVKGVLLKSGKRIEADLVILATGGASYSGTGSTGDGYKIASALGHTVTELKPSLVGLNCHEGFCTRLAGLSLKNVTLSVFEEGKKKPVYKELGEMLFTHTGVSGPLALSGSAYIRHLEKKNYYLEIDLKPALDEAQLDKRILRDFEEELNRNFANSLDKLLPKSLIPVVVSLSGIASDTKVNQISREQRATLVNVIKHLRLNVTSFRPLEEAIVTSGGIKVSEIDPSNMASKLVSGLFFAGEIIDVDAFTGGFNLQIAFSTGVAAADGVIEFLNNF